MLDFYENAENLLPAWFIPRMMRDSWPFGLMMTNGVTICIDQIDNVHQDASGTLWLDVQLLNKIPCDGKKRLFFVAPTNDRMTATINASHVMAAFELVDS